MHNIIDRPAENIQQEEYSIPSTDHGRLLLLLGLAFGIVAALVINFFVINRPYEYQGSLIEPSKNAPEFSLKDQYGDEFSLSQQTGNVVLIFFGYTHCQDVCPITIAEFKQIRQELEERAAQVKFVFITVDPERDTPEVIRNYINNFDPEIIGLTDDRSTLQEIWTNYGVVQEKPEESGSLDYLVDHTSRVYVVDKAGRLRMTYPFGFEINRVVEDLVHLLKEDEG